MNGTYRNKLMIICLLVVVGWFGATLVSPAKAGAATEESLGLLAIGKKYIGVDYKYGSASGNDNSFDCSSYTQYVFKKLGVELPRTSVAQSNLGEKVGKGNLSVGDLVFFKTGGNGISHVAIYAGNGNILHASSSKGVAITSMESSYWTKSYVTARRIL
jgi:cell wall-associated NlpC family hydrolase